MLGDHPSGFHVLFGQTPPTEKKTMKTLGLTVLLGVSSVLVACAREPGEPSRTDQALEELQRLVEQARERAPDDAVEWAREDLERYGDWEYRVVMVATLEPDEIEEQLNDLGQERWEVFWVDRTEQGLSLLLKRPAVSYLRAVPFSEIGRVIPGEG